MRRLLARPNLGLWILMIALGLLALVKGSPSSADSRPNPGVVEIKHPTDYDRVAAVSDVHGMLDTIQDLLRGDKFIDRDLHWSAGRTLLIVVGDSIDKGPHSLATLQFWLKISKEAAQSGGKVLHLLGNHEAEFLADPSNSKADSFRDEIRAQGLKVSDLTGVENPLGYFLRTMPLAARVGGWLFAHAGRYPKLRWDEFKSQAAAKLAQGDYQGEFITGDDSILEDKEWWREKKLRLDVLALLADDEIYGVVFGHQPKAFGVEGDVASSNDGRIYKVDSGMNPEAGSYAGALLVFTEPKELTLNQPPEHVYSMSDGVLSPVESKSSEENFAPGE